MTQNPPIATAEDLIMALQPTKINWRKISRRFEHIDDLVDTIVSTPLFRHTYINATLVYNLDSMTFDVKSGAGLLANNILTCSEIRLFTDRDMVHYLNAGMSLAARYLRERMPGIPQEQFVDWARTIAFTFIFKLIGGDLKQPVPTLQELIDQLEFPHEQKLSLLHAAIANASMSSQSITLH